MINRLSLSVQTLFAELLEQVRAAELSRNIGSLRGTITSKEVKGRRYCYLQYSEAGRQRQRYLGPEDEDMKARIARWRSGRQEAQTSVEARERLVSMLAEGRGTLVQEPVGALLRLLADAGVFRLGAVLVGTQAFRMYGNLLGVELSGAAMTTHDVDLAQSPAMALMVPGEGIELPSILQGAELGFLPIPGFDPRRPSTSWQVRSRGVRLDLLTPLEGASSATLVRIRALDAWATPLRFLDYLIDSPVQTVALTRAGLLVQIPQPARFAWHKLIVASRRPVSEQVKANKDRLQAAALFEVLLEDRPGDVRLAWDDLEARGPGWEKAARHGVDGLTEAAPRGALMGLIGG